MSYLWTALTMLAISSFDCWIFAWRLARLRAGRINAARIAIMLITTSNSMSVKPKRKRRWLLLFECFNFIRVADGRLTLDFNGGTERIFRDGLTRTTNRGARVGQD